ncbi:unnamed protein product [Coregonus sp. 'balchen']|nr:unnamed protein product [Coregonus sp. 'balchen']
MSKIQLLRVFLNERLSAAAEEILGAVEKTIAEEVSRSNEENDRLQRLLEIALIKLNRSGNPYCFAAQSENVDGIGVGGPPSGFKPVKSKTRWTVKRQSSHINTKGRKSTESSNLKSPRQRDNAPCRCKVCGKSFQYMGSLMKHVQTHTNEKEHICGVCGKCFESTESMKHHIQTHIADRMCCHVCSKCFTSNRDLIVHMRTHTGDKPYQCSDCGKEFSVRNSLKRHMKIHAGGKGYSCSHCDKCFSTSFRLTFHMMRSHRGETIQVSCM